MTLKLILSAQLLLLIFLWPHLTICLWFYFKIRKMRKKVWLDLFQRVEFWGVMSLCMQYNSRHAPRADLSDLNFKSLHSWVTVLQGVPFKKWIFRMAVALKRCIFDPMLVKPKCVWEVWKILNKQLKNVNKFLKIEKTAISQTHFGFTNTGSRFVGFKHAANRNFLLLILYETFL